MGSALGTTGLTIFVTIVIAVAAILIIVSDSKVREISGYPEVDNINMAHKDLGYAQIFAWIGAGLALVLAIGYGLSIKFLLSPWPHLILVLLIIATLICSIIYLGLALNKINNLNDDKGASGYIIWAIILESAALLMLIIALILGWSHTSTDPNIKEPEQSRQYNDVGYGYDYQPDPNYQQGRSPAQQGRYQPTSYGRYGEAPRKPLPPKPLPQTPVLQSKTTEIFEEATSPRFHSRPPAELPPLY